MYVRRSVLIAMLLMAGVLATGITQAALATGRSQAGPEINRIRHGGIARDLSVRELEHINRARGLVPRP